jgi:cytochrome c5
VKRLIVRVTLGCLFLGCLYCVLQTRAQNAQTETQAKTSKGNPKASQATPSADSEGERRFEAHCGRCHNPPEDLSPREARAVVRQMRVRAMLSAEDERLILKYVAP